MLKLKLLFNQLKITSSIEFNQWSKSRLRPHNFPANPNKIYKEEWKGWGDFLGTGNIKNAKKEWMPFLEAKAFIQSIEITSSTEFNQWRKSGLRPHNFPSNPERVYKKEWISWKDFLGINWMPFVEAKAFIQSIEITSSIEFNQWSKSRLRPHNFPANPNKIYKEEWKGWGDFLGTGNIKNAKKEWMSFQEAKAFIQTQGITSAAEFSEWSKSESRPHNFPSSPNKTYKENWKDWYDFLGTTKAQKTIQLI